ncbi:hypothetical protein F4680DRAFT_468061 [Xylaria scruposa]|nr:hypothetical protein F4680DRAFT_468061 [Xylaria scruposa]
MHTYRIATTTLLFGCPRLFVAGQQAQLAQVPIDACNVLPCAAEESNSVCSQSHQEDEVSAAPLVGIAANAINLTSDTKLSLTLVEEGRTIFANEPGLEAYERTLYVGPPRAFALPGNRPSAACALTLQYGSQTFPVPMDSERRGDINRTTSCAGVIDQDCFNTLADPIKSFDPDNENEVDCAALADFVNGRIHASDTLCTFYSNLITVTGAPLPNLSGGTSASFVDDKCKPVLPADNVLYRVGSVQTIVKPDDRIGGEIFGGRQGFTPVIAVLYDGGNVTSIQYACMQALLQGGSVLEDSSAASSNWDNSGLILSIVTFVTIAFGLI